MSIAARVGCQRCCRAGRVINGGCAPRCAGSMATGPHVFAVEKVAGCLVDVRTMNRPGMSGCRRRAFFARGSMEWVAEELVEGGGDGFRLVEVWDVSGVRDDGDV